MRRLFVHESVYARGRGLASMLDLLRMLVLLLVSTLVVLVLVNLTLKWSWGKFSPRAVCGCEFAHAVASRPPQLSQFHQPALADSPLFTTCAQTLENGICVCNAHHDVESFCCVPVTSLLLRNRHCCRTRNPAGNQGVPADPAGPSRVGSGGTRNPVFLPV